MAPPIVIAPALSPCAGDEVVDRMLFLRTFAREMPWLPEFSAAAKVRQDDDNTETQKRCKRGRHRRFDIVAIRSISDNERRTAPVLWRAPRVYDGVWDVRAVSAHG